VSDRRRFVLLLLFVFFFLYLCFRFLFLRRRFRLPCVRVLLFFLGFLLSGGGIAGDAVFRRVWGLPAQIWWLCVVLVLRR
jgi:hypothetical protein